MKKHLSHSKTKMELVVYLAQKAIKHPESQIGRHFVVAWASEWHNQLLIIEALHIKSIKPEFNSGLKASKELSLFT